MTFQEYQHQTPRHPPLSDHEYIEAIQAVVIEATDELCERFTHPIHYSLIESRVTDLIWRRKHWGLWKWQVPNLNTIERRINECADAKQDWSIFAGVPPLTSPGGGRYMSNPSGLRLPRELREKLNQK